MEREFVYSAYGVSFRLPFAAATPVAAVGALPDLILEERPATAAPRESEILYRSPQRLLDGTPFFRYSRAPGGDALTVGELMRFDNPRGPRIGFQRLASVSNEEVEAYFIGTVLPLWLELQGWLALHCSAVDVNGRVLAFLGRSGTGKSTLAAALLVRGHGLVTEDVLPLQVESDGEVVCRAGYPELKLADEAGSAVFGRRFLDLPSESFAGHKRKVPIGKPDWGVFQPGRHRPSALIVPDRCERPSAQAPRLNRMESRVALVELMRFSFHARLVEVLGLAPRRLEALSAIVKALPTYCLTYPSGLEKLDRVCALLEDEAA